MAHEQYIQYSDNDLARLLGLDEPIERLEMIRRLNADDVEDFAVALSAAIDSQIDVPGAHAVTAMYRAALARAEQAEAEAERLQAALDASDEDANWISSLAAQRDELEADLEMTTRFYGADAERWSRHIEQLEARVAELEATP